jgi:uncharacterized protein YecT (DUF1311 family)
MQRSVESDGARHLRRQGLHDSGQGAEPGLWADDADGRNLLTTAQKAWIAFRDAECDFQAGNSVDGSIYPMLIAMCRTGLTQKRTEELKVYLNCDEGDTLCPVPAP